MPPRPTTPHVVQVGANAHSGAAAFAHALRDGGAPRLEALWLGGNEIGDRGAVALSHALWSSHAGGAGALRTLALYSNAVGDEGALSLAEALEESYRHQRWGRPPPGSGGSPWSGGSAGAASKEPQVRVLLFGHRASTQQMDERLRAAPGLEIDSFAHAPHDHGFGTRPYEQYESWGRD